MNAELNSSFIIPHGLRLRRDSPPKLKVTRLLEKHAIRRQLQGFVGLGVKDSVLSRCPRSRNDHTD